MKRSRITWTDYSGGDLNVVTGCTPVSEGCANCYARAIYERFGLDHSKVVIRGELDVQPTPRGRVQALGDKQVSEWQQLIASLPYEEPARLTAEGLTAVLSRLLESMRDADGSQP